MEEQWCKCRVVEPQLTQKGNILVCLNCREQKELPPLVDLKWIQLKRKVLQKGRVEYETLSKEGLIDLLIKRDELLLDKYNVPIDFSYKDPLFVQNSLKEQMQAELKAHIPYLKFKAP